MITVVREDLKAGYQIAQTAHSVAEFSYKKPFLFRRWRRKSGYLISLAVANLKSLVELTRVLDQNKVGYVPFFEPDIGELTAITIAPSERADELTKGLNLAGKTSGSINKHKK